MIAQSVSETHGEPPLNLHGRYRLIERIGEGSMGMVYRAYDETLGRDVAIKFLHAGRIASEASGARFLREARAVARLSHPNIMTLYDVGQQGEWHYLVLEYVPGHNLHDRMVARGGPLALEEALHAIRGALEALSYAHARGIVHRDIKPENIMLTPDGQVTVTDFGLALARGDPRLTQEGMIVGTVLYLAPEVISGTPPDRRSDLYALGAVFYELLTGHPPFAGDDPLIVFSQILNAPLTAPRTLNGNIPAAVERVLLKLLAKKPEGRYPTAEEALAALDEAAPPSQTLRATPPQAYSTMPSPIGVPATGTTIRILLVDDQALFRAGLRTLLSVQPDFEIVGEAGNGQQALYAAEQLCPDVVLMDLRMPVLDGVATTHRLRTVRPDCKVIVLTTFDDDEYVFDALRAGALGYLLKDAAPDALYSAIRAAARGESVLQPSVAAKVVSQFARMAGQAAPRLSRQAAQDQDLVEPLSEREIEVLRVIAQGRTNKEIAAELYIAEGTVKNHVTSILSKLGVRDRTQAAIKGREMGLL